MIAPLDIRIRSARDRGFVVLEGDEVIAATSDLDDLLLWLERHCGGSEASEAPAEAMPRMITSPDSQPPGVAAKVVNMLRGS